MPTLLDRLRSIWSLKPHRELSSLIAHYNLQGCSPEYQCLGAPSPSFLGRSLGLSILKGPQPFQQKPRLRASAPHSLSQFHFFVPPASPSTHNLCLSPLSSPAVDDISQLIFCYLRHKVDDQRNTWHGVEQLGCSSGKVEDGKS